MMRRPVERRSSEEPSERWFCPRTRCAIKDWTFVLMRPMGKTSVLAGWTVCPARLNVRFPCVCGKGRWLLGPAKAGVPTTGSDPGGLLLSDHPKTCGRVWESEACRR